MLFYTLFPEENLCVFSAAGRLTLDEMRICHQELSTEPAWSAVETIVTDLRGCWDVDTQFSDHHTRRRMQHNAFGRRRMIWLTGSSSVLGKLTMAENDTLGSYSETRIFQNKDEMEYGLGAVGAGILQCLNKLE